MRKYLLPLATAFCLIMAAPVVQAQTFVRYYDPAPTSNKFEDIAVLANGNYVCAGYNNGPQGNTAFTVVYSPTGNILNEWWSDTVFAGSLVFAAVAATSDGSYVAAGGSNASFDIVKFNMQGNVMWNARIDTFEATGYKPWYCFAVEETPDGGFAAAGLAYQLLPGNISSNPQIYVVKLDDQGNHLWTYQYGGPWDDRPQGIINTSDGGLLITGYTKLDSLGAFKPVVIKLDQQGVEEWAYSYNYLFTPTLSVTAVETANGDYIVAATIFDTVVNQLAGALLSIDANGDSITTTHFLDPDNSYYFEEIKSTNDGGYVVAGYVELQNFTSQSTLLLKFDDQLQEVWQQHLHGSTNAFRATGVCQAPDGGYVISSRNLGDAGAIFKTDALGHIAHTLIQGHIVGDANLNCSIDSGEHFLPNHMVEVLANIPYYGYTDTNGFYSINVYDTGQAVINWTGATGYWATAPCQSNNFTANLVDGDTLDLDFFAEPLINCPNLTVKVSNAFLRRCFGGQKYTVSYCNNGTQPAPNTYIELEFDPTLIVDSASVAWALPQIGNTYRFDVGGLGFGQCGSFQVWVTVDCDSTILGQAHCVEAHIYPDSICTPLNPGWDGSSLQLLSRCLPGDTIEFELKNIGSGDMGGPKNYIIVEDNVMYQQGQFELNSGQLMFERIKGNGKTYTMIVPQSEGHPGRSAPLKSVEGCGRNANNSFSIGFLAQFPQDDQDDFIDILCLPNIGAYDPNDKRPEPLGVGAEGYINATQPLDYTIRFQNTGTDTAFTVVIRDTLSPHLDITTLQLNAASHNYTFQIVGSNVLEWTFPNILLPDSNVNEPLSHGFVSFGINQVDGNTPGTEITNRAGIYFDFNAPIITNTTLNTVIADYKTWFTFIQSPESKFQLGIYPNPNNGTFSLDFATKLGATYEFIIFDLAGAKQFGQALSGGAPYAMQPELPTGMYIYQLLEDGRPVSMGKVLVNR